MVATHTPAATLRSPWQMMIQSTISGLQETDFCVRPLPSNAISLPVSSSQRPTMAGNWFPRVSIQFGTSQAIPTLPRLAVVYDLSTTNGCLTSSTLRKWINSCMFYRALTVDSRRCDQSQTPVSVRYHPNSFLRGS